MRLLKFKCPKCDFSIEEDFCSYEFMKEISVHERSHKEDSL